MCDNETNAGRIWPGAASPPFPKDGIHDHIVHGSATVNPALLGTKAAFWFQDDVHGGGPTEARLRLSPSTGATPDLGKAWEQVMSSREAEAAGWHAHLVAAGSGTLDADDSAILRRRPGCCGRSSTSTSM